VVLILCYLIKRIRIQSILVIAAAFYVVGLLPQTYFVFSYRCFCFLSRQCLLDSLNGESLCYVRVSCSVIIFSVPFCWQIQLKQSRLYDYLRKVGVLIFYLHMFVLRITECVFYFIFKQEIENSLMRYGLFAFFSGLLLI